MIKKAIQKFLNWEFGKTLVTFKLDKFRNEKDMIKKLRLKYVKKKDLSDLIGLEKYKT